MTGRQMLFRDLVADGFFVDELRESREIGVQEGVQKVLALLDEDTRKKLQQQLQPV
jgi:hypothetical protein